MLMEGSSTNRMKGRQWQREDPMKDEDDDILSKFICLSDLESDYINPYDLSSRINAIVTKEFLVQGMLCGLFLLTWHWFMFLISAPLAYYHLKLYMNQKHLIDVTEIFSVLNAEKKYRVIKIGFYLVLFIVVLFRLVVTAVELILDEDG